MSTRTDDLPAMTGDGVAPVKIKALDNRVEKWREIVAERMAMTEKEVEARDAVIEVMREKGIQSYVWHDGDDTKRLVKLVAKEKLKLEKDKYGEAPETDINDD
jgi:hypothetical protein